MPFHQTAAAGGAVQGFQSGLSSGNVGLAIAGGLFGAIGGALAGRKQKRARRRQRKAIAQARGEAQRIAKKFTSSQDFLQARDFVRGAFQTGGGVLAQDFAKQIRSAQSVRGLFTGNVGAAAEAQGTSAFSARLRQSLLPISQQFAGAEERIEQQAFQSRVGPLVAGATGGAGFGTSQLGGSTLSAINQFITGAGGGFNIGSAFRGRTRQARDQQLGRRDQERAVAQGQAGGQQLQELIAAQSGQIQEQGGRIASFIP